MKQAITISAGVIVAVLLGMWYISTSQPAVGNGYLGFPVHIQSATTTVVGADTIVTVFAKANDCKNRVITTAERGIRISFGDVSGFGSTTLSSSVGHWQVASTTVAYESGVYGCGRLTAFGGASTTLTISNF